LAATHTAPPLRILAIMAPSTAASTSASANTTNGALPPSSMEQLTTRGAACASSREPTRVEPVKDSLRTGCAASIASTAGPGGCGTTTFTTPAGTPARSSRSASASAVSGVSPAGFSTTVQPAASAGPILRVAMAAGKFQGVMRTLTPMG
jgi:hypothetical protein